MLKILLFLFSIHSIFSDSKPFIILDNLIEDDITSYVQYFEYNEKKVLTHDEILERNKIVPLSKIIITENPEKLTSLISNNYYTFHLESQLNAEKEFVINLTNPFIYEIELVCIGKNKTEYKSGTKYSYSTKPIPYRYFALPIKIAQGEKIVCTMFSNQEGGRQIDDFQIVSLEKFNVDNIKQEIFFGILYGILIFAFINSIILLITFKQIIYFYYSMYILSVSITMLSTTGDLSRFVGESFLYPHVHFLGISGIPIAVLFIVEFARLFFEVHKFSKLANILSTIPRYLVIPILLTSLLNSIKVFLLLSNLFSLLTTSLGVYLGYSSWRLGYTYAKYYLWSYIVLFFGITISFFSFKMGFTTSEGSVIIYFSILTEIFLLSIALAEKQRVLENEKKLAQEKTIEVQKEANENLERKVEERTYELKNANELIHFEKEKSDKLLLNILPIKIADELKEKGKVIPKSFMATILFTDFQGFTKISERMKPEDLIFELDECFKYFDNLMDEHKIEKLKTIGDSFMCAGGIPIQNDTHPIDIINAAIKMRDFIFNRNLKLKSEGKEVFEIRIGVHTGKVIAGVIGEKKFSYDIWGDTVNIASRMESSGEAGKINISETTYHLIKDKFNCEPRGEVYAKNKGQLQMYFVNSRK